MKKIITIFLSFVILFSVSSFLISCSNKDNEVKQNTQIIIPDVLGTDENTAKTVLLNKGFIPKCEYDWSNIYPEGQVCRVEPNVNTNADEGSIINIIISKGPSYYSATSTVGYMYNIDGVNAFSWEDDTKGFYGAYVMEGYLYITMYICCVSDYSVSFFNDFGTASTTEDFEQSIPIGLEYDNKLVNTLGEKTTFTVKVSIENLGIKKPSNLYIKFDFVVAGERETFQAGFDIAW